MFTTDEIIAATNDSHLKKSIQWVRESLIRSRLAQPLTEAPASIGELAHFVECVLCSAPDWTSSDGQELCLIAAETAELLSKICAEHKNRASTYQIRSALLYEMAGKPSIATSVARDWKLNKILSSFISRRDAFGQLRPFPTQPKLPDIPTDPGTYHLLGFRLFEFAWSQDALLLSKYEHGEIDLPRFVTERLEGLATSFSLGARATDLHAFSSVIRSRAKLATRNYLNESLFEAAKHIGFPIEMWPQQAKALQAGFLDKKFDTFGLAAPTGTGKTFLGRILILDTLLHSPKSKVLYIVPSKALATEVTNDLSKAFEDTEYTAIALRPSLVALDEKEGSRVEKDSVIVLTPEKADLLLRLGSAFLGNVELVIVDEAHHIESGTRGILLEMYLTRLKHSLRDGARIAFLSAVAPNIKQLASSFGKHAGGSEVEDRATKMRAGVYKIKGKGKSKQGWIEYADGTALNIVTVNVETRKRHAIIQLTGSLAQLGPVLVVTKGKGECETLGRHMLDWVKKNSPKNKLGPSEIPSEYFQRLDAYLEREMYKEVPMRELLPYRIAYHHAGLPPRVRRATEEAIRRGLVDFVFATTTLAEGVNFPFSSVVVQSLALKTAPEPGVPSRYQPVTPRSFWNIAGRAGRPGYDSEGHAILFEPSLGLDKVNAVISDYLNSSFRGVPPVGSALADAIREIQTGVSTGMLSWSQLESHQLDPSLPRPIQGAVNLIRTSIIHAKAGGWDSPEEILESTFASQLLLPTERNFGRELAQAQARTVNSFFNEVGAPSWTLAAEIGLSIETLSSLRDYAKVLPDFRIEMFHTDLFYGGWINFAQAKPLISEVSMRMAELEGTKLGAMHTDLVAQWLSGIPFTNLKQRSRSNKKHRRLEDLISILYSRIQFLLPWGLYATDRIIETEAKERGLEYKNEIRWIAYLVDAGVPSFDALRLVDSDMERVDATRIATEFKKAGGIDSGTDVVGWLSTQKSALIKKYLKGPDNRRLDHDLDRILWQMFEEE